MDYRIREIRENEYYILSEFLYEAIFIPEGMEKPPKAIIEQPELQVYIADFGKSDDWCLVADWMRNHSTISFLGLWEQIHNPNFKPIEFDRFKAESGDNAFTLTPQQWTKATDAIGIISKSGRYGGTYAHTDIAFEFASWISPEFKLYIIKEYESICLNNSYKSGSTLNRAFPDFLNDFDISLISRIIIQVV